jgi:hypothetical protein
MRVQEIQSLADLTGEVQELISKTNLVWWFRGHSNSSWNLLPSARRGYTREQERYFSNEFFVRAKLRHHSSPNEDDYAGWLALMQHYGLPTRLLDWTRSPLVAAFFATEPFQRHSDPALLDDQTEIDACIWAIAPSLLNTNQGFENYLLPLSARQLEKLVRPSRKGRDTSDRVAAAMAIETDPRMQMQQGAFTVHASGTPLNRMRGCGQWLRQYVIPFRCLPLMAQQLDLLGFRLGDLFPDLGNLARELKGRHRRR